MDVFSLELAIYFVLPPLMLFAAAHLLAVSFALVAQLVLGRDIAHDEAVTAMAILIAATASVATLAYWTIQVVSVATVLATGAYFFVGAITYSRIIEDDCRRNRRRRVVPIGLPKGLILSSVFTLCTVAIGLLVLLIAVGFR